MTALTTDMPRRHEETVKIRDGRGGPASRTHHCLLQQQQAAPQSSSSLSGT